MPTGTYNFDDAFALTTKYIDDQVQEVFTNTTPLLNEIMKKKQYVDGGNRLTVALNYNKMGNIQFITGTSADLIDISTQQNALPAELDWKFLQTGFSITLADLVKTADSKHAIMSMMKLKAENSIASTKQFMAGVLYGSAADDPLAFNGFGDIFAGAGTTYAGLSDTDLGVDSVGDKIWLPEIDTTTPYVDYQAISPVITKLKTRTKSGGVSNKLDYMISNASVLSDFKVQQQQQQRFLPAKDLDAGFDGLMVDGVLWYADEFCPGSGTGVADNHLYLISSDSIKFMYKYGFGKNSPQDVSGVRIPNQPIMTHQKFIAGNLFCVNRRVNGVFKNLNPGERRAA